MMPTCCLMLHSILLLVLPYMDCLKQSRQLDESSRVAVSALHRRLVWSSQYIFSFKNKYELLERKKEIIRTPIKAKGERIKNALKNNFRGLSGVAVPLLVLLPQANRFDQHIKLLLMWQWMLWFYLTQPIGVPCTSMIPIFFLPMAGIYNSLKTCKCYMNESIMLYITSSYLLVLLNNSGLDKRIGLWFLCHGNNNGQFTGKKLVLKASAAAFFLSIFSSRLIATFNLTETITNAFERIESPTRTVQPAGSKSIDITAMRYVINNAIQTSASIGGLAIIHASWVTLLFRACFNECIPDGFENPDIFNFLTYSVFAFPLAFVLFIFNLIYHMILMHKFPLLLLIVFYSTHQKILFQYSAIFTILLLLALFSRYNKFMDGWALPVENLEKAPYVLRVKDATVTAIFVILLHIIPKGFDFLKIFSVKIRRDLPILKPESAVLWWRFVDKNVNYGYIFTFGSAISLIRAGIALKLSPQLTDTIGMSITDQSWNMSLLFCIVIAAVLSNVMTSMAACSIFLPYILLLAEVSQFPWPYHYYLGALSIGLACNLGFCTPFLYTPAYYCHHTGRVPIKYMIKYSIPAVLIGIIIVYAFVTNLAPAIFDPNVEGHRPLPADKKALKAYLIKIGQIVITTTPTTLPPVIDADAKPADAPVID